MFGAAMLLFTYGCDQAAVNEEASPEDALSRFLAAQETANAYDFIGVTHNLGLQYLIDNPESNYDAFMAYVIEELANLGLETESVQLAYIDDETLSYDREQAEDVIEEGASESVQAWLNSSESNFSSLAEVRAKEDDVLSQMSEGSMSEEDGTLYLVYLSVYRHSLEYWRGSGEAGKSSVVLRDIVKADAAGAVAGYLAGIWAGPFCIIGAVGGAAIASLAEYLDPQL